MNRIAVCAALTLYGLAFQAPLAVAQTSENVAVVINDKAYVWGGSACPAGYNCARLFDPVIGLIWSPPKR